MEYKLHHLDRDTLRKVRCDVDECGKPAHKTYWTIEGEGNGRVVRFHIECFIHFTAQEKYWIEDSYGLVRSSA